MYFYFRMPATVIVAGLSCEVLGDRIATADPPQSLLADSLDGNRRHIGRQVAFSLLYTVDFLGPVNTNPIGPNYCGLACKVSGECTGTVSRSRDQKFAGPALHARA